MVKTLTCMLDSCATGSLTVLGVTDILILSVHGLPLRFWKNAAPGTEKLQTRYWTDMLLCSEIGLVWWGPVTAYAS